MSEKFTTIPIDLLVFSGRNPRHEMRGLEELAENIKQYSVRQPIIVRPKEEKFEVVTGERRVRASIMAGLKEIPAIIRALTDRQADIERLIENILRDDLTNAEKGDAVYALLDEYPDEYPTIKSVSETLTIPYYTIAYDWLPKARKASDSLKKHMESHVLKEDQVAKLVKYPHITQDILAQKIIEHKLTTLQTRKFLKLYDEIPHGDLNEIAMRAKGIERVRVPLEELPEEVREEVKRVIKEKKREAKKKRKKALEKARKAPRRPRPKKKEKEPTPSLLPEERERLEKYRRRLVRVRREKAKSIQAKVEAEERVPKADIRHNVVIGDAGSVLKHFPASSVDLVVTSPPYFDLKEYPDNPLRINTQSIERYLKDLRPIFNECFRVLRDGRFFCVAIGQFTSEEMSYFIPAYIAQMLEDIGFKYRREHIWVKPLGIQGIWNRGTTKFLKEPYPRNAMINIHHEHILVFQKGDRPEVIYGRNPLSEDEVKEYCWSVWELPVSEVKAHPAPFPEEIPRRLIKMYSYEGEVVLDPFLGSGTCTKVAKDLNRCSIGIELMPEYLYLTKMRVEGFNIIRHDEGEKVDLSLLKERPA